MQSAIQTHASVAVRDPGEAPPNDNKSTHSAYHSALKQFTSGNMREAKAIVQSVLALDPDDAKALHLMGLILCELGDQEGAVARFRGSVAADPSDVVALSDLAALLRDRGQVEESLTASLTAITIDAKYYPAYANLGRIYDTLGKPEESAVCYLQVVQIAPDYPRGYYDLGLAYLKLGQTGAAVEACRKAAEFSPDDTDILLALGTALERAGKLGEAIDLYESADLRQKGQLPVLCALASSYAETGQIEKALATHRRSLELAPDHEGAHIALGETYRKVGRASEALDCYRRALAVTPDHAVAIARLAEAQADLGELGAALENSKRAITLDAGLIAPYRTISHALARLGKHSEAFALQAKAVMLDRHDRESQQHYFELARKICDWSNISEIGTNLRNSFQLGEQKNPPTALLDMETSAEDMLLGARSWARRLPCENELVPAASKPRSRVGDPVRLGYLYDECGNGELAEFLGAVIANHDRSRFHVSGFRAGVADGPSLLEKSYDAHDCIGHLSHADAAAKIHEAGIDVLINIDGCRSRAVPGILAHRPAPIQVSYLGYPATMGAEFVDYIVGDPYITALDQQPFFNEKIVQLAECLMVAMPTGVIPQSAEAMDRHALGLPENGIVFCCFNPVRTISADCFAVWAGILKNTPGSVLWLLDDNDAATANLKRNAAALGVDPARLVFAPSRARNMHLARLPFADLYLDTTPSSSTVAIADALASGVPVLTCAGETMASRLSGSMLSACGLRDMITHALEHYEHAARMLTCNPRSLKQLRVRLANARQTAKFFDTEHYQSALDAAYEHMMAIARNGEWPYAFAVAPGKTNKQKNAAEQTQRTPREDQPFLLAEADVC